MGEDEFNRDKDVIQSEEFEKLEQKESKKSLIKRFLKKNEKLDEGKKKERSIAPAQLTESQVLSEFYSLNEKFDKTLIQVEKLSGKLEMEQSSQAAFGERLMELSSQLGELRSVIVSKSKFFDAIEDQFNQIVDELKSIKPEKIQDQFEKLNRRLVLMEASIERNSSRGDQLEKELAHYRDQMGQIESFEALLNSLKNNQAVMKDINNSRSQIERYATKSELIYSELNEKLTKIDSMDSRVNSNESSVRDLIKSMDRAELRLGALAPKDDVNTLKKQVSQIKKAVFKKDMEKFFSLFQKFPGLAGAGGAEAQLPPAAPSKGPLSVPSDAPPSQDVVPVGESPSAAIPSAAMQASIMTDSPEVGSDGSADPSLASQEPICSPGPDGASQDPPGSPCADDAPQEPICSPGPDAASQDPPGSPCADDTPQEPISSPGPDAASQDPPGSPCADDASQELLSPGPVDIPPITAESLPGEPVSPPDKPQMNSETLPMPEVNDDGSQSETFLVEESPETSAIGTDATPKMNKKFRKALHRPKKGKAKKTAEKVKKDPEEAELEVLFQDSPDFNETLKEAMKRGSFAAESPLELGPGQGFGGEGDDAMDGTDPLSPGSFGDSSGETRIDAQDGQVVKKLPDPDPIVIPLLEFIARKKGEGYSMMEIRDSITRKGWPTNYIDYCMDYVS